MSIKTSTVEILPLRGMDDRWLAKGNKARLITDMTWTPKEGWRQAGGFDRMVPDYYWSTIKDRDLPSTSTAVLAMRSADTEPTKISNPGRADSVVSPKRGPVSTVSIRTAGSSYVAGDTLTVGSVVSPTPGTGVGAAFTVDTVAGGVLATLSVLRNGSAYSVGDALTLAGGSGSGGVLLVTAIIDVADEKPAAATQPERGTVTSATSEDSALQLEQRSGMQYGSMTQARDGTLEPKGSEKSNPYDRHKTPWNLHWFSQFNGAIQFTVYETTDGGMYHFHGAGSPFRPWRNLYHVDGREYNGADKKRTVLDSWSGTHFQCYGGNLYGVNGYDEPIVFDGRKVTRAGFGAAPAGIEADLVHDTDNTNTQYAYTEASHFGIGDRQRLWGYRWKVTFVNERGQESPMSISPARAFHENPSAQRSMVTLTLPLGPVGTVARRIYRTQNMRNTNGTIRDKIYGEEFYFVAEVQDNIGTVFVDVHSDTDLGALHTPENYGAWPAAASTIASFKSTIFIANSDSSALRFSSPRMPEEFPELNFIEIGDSNAGPIVAMYATKNALVVFKSRGIYLLKGDPVDGFFCLTLTRDLGCAASKSIRELPGSGLVFMSNDGVYLLEGAFENTGTITGITRLGEPVESELLRVNMSSAESIRSGINQRDRELWLAVPTKGSAIPNRLLKFHYEIGEWSVAPDFDVYDMVATEDHRSYMVLASSSEASGSKGLMVYSRAYTSKGATAVSSAYKTVFLSPNSLYSAFSVARLQVYAIGYGNNDLEANFIVNRELSESYSSALSRDQKRPREDAAAAVYGTATWGSVYKWSEHRPVPIRYDLSALQKGPVQEIAFNFAPAGSRVQIIGYRLDIRIGTRREVVALVDLFGKGV